MGRHWKVSGGIGWQRWFLWRVKDKAGRWLIENRVIVTLSVGLIKHWSLIPPSINIANDPRATNWPLLIRVCYLIQRKWPSSWSFDVKRFSKKSWLNHIHWKIRSRKTWSPIPGINVRRIVWHGFTK